MKKLNYIDHKFKIFTSFRWRSTFPRIKTRCGSWVTLDYRQIEGCNQWIIASIYTGDNKGNTETSNEYSREDETCAKSTTKSKITGIWACYFNNLREIMEKTGGNQYKPAHNNSRNLREISLKPLVLKVDIEDYDRCVDLLNGV